jgi:hypothetical protein
MESGACMHPCCLNLTRSVTYKNNIAELTAQSNEQIMSNKRLTFTALGISILKLSQTEISPS